MNRTVCYLSAMWAVGIVIGAGIYAQGASLEMSIGIGASQVAICTILGMWFPRD